MAKRIEALDISDTRATELMPLFTILAPINEQIAVADHELARLCEENQTVALLATAPAIGPVTAAAVVSTVDDTTRFRSAHQFEAFLGLVAGHHHSADDDADLKDPAPCTQPAKGRIR